MYQPYKNFFHLIGLIACCLLFPLSVLAQTLPSEPAEVELTQSSEMNTVNSDDEALDKTLKTLNSFIILRKKLQKDIEIVRKQLKSEQTEIEKEALKQHLLELQSELRSTKKNFRDIAAGVDISILKNTEEPVFDFEEELSSLLKPAFDEMKEMTSQVRKKSELKEKIIFYEERLPVLEKALSHIKKLNTNNKNESLRKVFDAAILTWEQKQSFMLSELQASNLQLNKLLAAETSVMESSQSYLKSFFQKRGLYLSEAILVVFSIFLLSKFFYNIMYRLMPGFKAEHRSFRFRLLELLHRLFTILFMIMGPMVVFYMVEDWVLFSLGILLLLGLSWTLKQALPHYWKQVYLFLNIGSVRENERIFMQGLPWKVQRINFFTKLINPVADLSLRIPLNELVDLTSRPFEHSEPWFPCQKGDWVILNNGVRGKVTGISLELIELIERGGAKHTYQTSDFLANAPRNLATNFRIKETLGISYSLQQECTTSIPDLLHQFIKQKFEQSEYGNKLLNLRVEFELANNSSLDIVIIADFKGELGDLYNRLRRAIQRWSVEACTEYDWEIPFPQMTLHGEVHHSE